MNLSSPTQTGPQRWRGYALVLLAATLWGTLGLFYTHLLDGYGLSTLTLAFFRALLTALILFGTRFVLRAMRPQRQQTDQQRVTRRDLAGFAVFGLLGVAAFYIVYAGAINRAGVGVSAVLMYTAPAWVTGLSALLLGERLTRRKGFALLLVILGAALVARLYDPGTLTLDPLGVLLGLGAGLTYGLYTLFSKVALRRFDVWTVLAWALAFGALFMLPVQSGEELARAATTPVILVWLVMTALVPTLLAGVSFNLGLRDLPASHASIVATWEPFVAVGLGALVLGEQFDVLQLGGGALIVAAVIVLSLGRRHHPKGVAAG
ncbi:MAG: EamA family transporter [Anaerolineae bacterium]|nr:EamA family transporter [Anaerolineae bacterium]